MKLFVSAARDGSANLTSFEFSPSPEKLAKTLFSVSRSQIAIKDIPNVVRTRVAAEFPNATLQEKHALWRRNIHFSEYKGPQLSTCKEFEMADIPYHLIGNGDPMHEVCTDPNCHDRYFRNACEFDGTVVSLVMVKARAVHMDFLRHVRDEELVKESGSERRQPSEIETLFTPVRKARLQALRDIPETFDLTVFGSPEELKAAWPTEFPSRDQTG